MSTSLGSAQWVTDYFCPALGVLICNVMWLSPMTAIRSAQKDGDIKNINATPFVITIINCIGWCIYSCILRDYFIFFANATGLLLGLYYSLVAFELLAIGSTRVSKESMEAGSVSMYIHHKAMLNSLNSAVLFGVAYWAIACLVSFIILGNSSQDRAAAALVIGISSVIASLSYYAAPLSTIYTVVRTCNSSTLYPPLIITNLVNALMWVIYGAISLKDPLIYIPNAIGFAFGIIQLLLVVLLRRSAADAKDFGVTQQQHQHDDDPARIPVSTLDDDSSRDLEVIVTSTDSRSFLLEEKSI